MGVRLRAAAGMINRADSAAVFIRYGDDPEAGFYLPITKASAKTILKHAYDHDVEEIDIEVNRKGVALIGEPIDLVEETEPGEST
jgi:hypothetical protein